MNSEQKTKTVKAVKRTLSALWWVFVILLFALLISVIGAKLSGKVPSVFGYSVMNIISGSMEDEIPKDSYILIKRVDAEEIECGDVICFYSSDPKIYGMPNTHRVVEDPIVTESGIEFITRGDANPINDSVTAKGDRLIGVHVKNLDGLTAFSNALKGNLLLIVIIGLQLCITAMVVYVAVTTKNKTSADEEIKK